MRRTERGVLFQGKGQHGQKPVEGDNPLFSVQYGQVCVGALQPLYATHLPGTYLPDICIILQIVGLVCVHRALPKT